jgi:predicted nucleotidyltransferase component of viral defense system
MNAHTERQWVELFHLLLLAQLGRKLDKRFYCLKGGCNLRFFFRSPRYSEDMDLDVHGMAVHDLRERVNAVLASKAFGDVLRTAGLEIEHITEHKQTDTTQRWKLGLLTPAADSPIPTKIEFSRRRMDAGAVFEAVDPQVVRDYGLPPVMVSHYDADAAFRQKLDALASRATTQARDIFDLHLLLASGRVRAIPASVTKSARAEARDRVMKMSFGTYKSQVVSFLLPPDQAVYGSEEAWDAMRLKLDEWLGRGMS